MLKSYEAMYEHGRIRWLDAPPDIAQARVIVTVLREAANDQPTPLEGSAEAVDALLSRTAGAWGQRSREEVAAMLAAQREADWGKDD